MQEMKKSPDQIVGRLFYFMDSLVIIWLILLFVKGKVMIGNKF